MKSILMSLTEAIIPLSKDQELMRSIQNSEKHDKRAADNQDAIDMSTSDTVKYLKDKNTSNTSSGDLESIESKLREPKDIDDHSKDIRDARNKTSLSPKQVYEPFNIENASAKPTWSQKISNLAHEYGGKISKKAGEYKDDIMTNPKTSGAIAAAVAGGLGYLAYKKLRLKPSTAKTVEKALLKK